MQEVNIESEMQKVLGEDTKLSHYYRLPDKENNTKKEEKISCNDEEMIRWNGWKVRGKC